MIPKVAKDIVIVPCLSPSGPKRFGGIGFRIARGLALRRLFGFGVVDEGIQGSGLGRVVSHTSSETLASECHVMRPNLNLENLIPLRCNRSKQKPLHRFWKLHQFAVDLAKASGNEHSPFGETQNETVTPEWGQF